MDRRGGQRDKGGEDRFPHLPYTSWASLVAQMVKESACSAGDLDSIPGLGRSPGEGNGNPLQNSCLKNPIGRGAWQATVHEVTKSRTQLRDFTSLHLNTHLCSMFLSQKDPPSFSIPSLSLSEIISCMFCVDCLHL